MFISALICVNESNWQPCYSRSKNGRYKENGRGDQSQQIESHDIRSCCLNRPDRLKMSHSGHDGPHVPEARE
jgi:hypothetical protein